MRKILGGSWLLSIVMCLTVAGCASEPPPIHPGPTDISIRMDLKINLPPTVAQYANIPQVNAKLIADAHAEATQFDPLRSKYTSTIHFFVSNPDNGQTYINFNSQIDGQSAGSPNQGILALLDQTGDLIGLMNKVSSLSSATQPSRSLFDSAQGHASVQFKSDNQQMSSGEIQLQVKSGTTRP